MTSPGVARGRAIPRKTLHLTTAVVPIGLFYGVPQRVMAVALLVLFGIACAVEYARRRSPAFAARFSGTVGVLLRPHEVTRGVTGATWLLGAFALTCLTVPLSAAIAATWAGAVGDAAAAIVGRAWSRARASTGKTLAGSAACVVTTALGLLWLTEFSAVAASLLGLVAAAVERPSVALDDNVRVTVSVAIVAAVFLWI